MNPIPPSSPPRLLIVEDNPPDVRLMRNAFKHASLPVDIDAVGNGRECLAYLRGEGEHAGRPRPDLVLLDLHMPVMDGRATLAAIMADPTLRELPVVVLTTSQSERDVSEMYALGCRTYIVKPAGFAELMRAAETLYRYWFTLAALPGPPAGRAAP
ncbi:MAG TPA: response regulator [Albitalea sp.]